MRGDEHRFYSSFGPKRYHDCHHDHPYKRSDMRYFPNMFKKENPHTFDGGLKKPEHVEAWLLEMKNLFEFQDYAKNMKAIIAIFSLKGKVDIWWEDGKWVGDIKIEELS